ncbi:MAG: hypothetical protein DSY99_05090 [Candidatus Neomarinimicrobiota bacterium]|nr:MAG: hypothetical protein DSY99_05090 [Candidatus Neomarinimicrobiota bacterium]
MKLSKLESAYLAGFLDADGSIYVQLKSNETYKYKFQIATNVVFYQSVKEKQFMNDLKRIIKKGYIRERKDGMLEYIIGDQESIITLLSYLRPYLKLKTKQANLIIEIIKMKKSIKSVNDFLGIVRKVDLFKKLNYSKRRKYNYSFVRGYLKKKNLLTP